MKTPKDPKRPENALLTNKWRTGLLAAGGVIVVVAVVAGITYANNSPTPKTKVAELAVSALRSPAALVTVQSYSKMQAHGPNYSLHRPIDIASHVRRATAAA